jgi:hypothetical protein
MRSDIQRNDTQHNNKLNVTLSIMALSMINGSYVKLSVIYAECRKQTRYSQLHYAECRYSECRGAASWALQVYKAMNT